MASTALTTQINVRMNKDLKEKGDAGLASLGVTPTEAIRHVWELAASGGAGLKKLDGFLSASVASPGDAATQRARAIEEGKTLFSTYLRSVGISEDDIRGIAAVDTGNAAIERTLGEDQSLLLEALLAKHGDAGET